MAHPLSSGALNHSVLQRAASLRHASAMRHAAMMRHLHAARQTSATRYLSLALSSSMMVGAHVKSAQAGVSRGSNRGGSHSESGARKSTKAHGVASHGTHNSEEKLPGAWAWTSGSQTYLRVRPGALTPAVAKVPMCTRMFVWGKYNGWYRVETVDHKFGWVLNDYLNCPKAHKIETLSQRKARAASDRGARQKLYGSPVIMKRYLARYGVPNAKHDGAKNGRLVLRDAALAPKSAKPIAKTAVAARTKVASAPLAIKSVSPTITPKASVLRVRLAKAPVIKKVRAKRVVANKAPRLAVRPPMEHWEIPASAASWPSAPPLSAVVPLDSTVTFGTMSAPGASVVNPFAPRGLPTGINKTEIGKSVPKSMLAEAPKSEATPARSATPAHDVVANPFAPRGLSPQAREAFTKTRPSASPGERLATRPDGPQTGAWNGHGGGFAADEHSWDVTSGASNAIPNSDHKTVTDRQAAQNGAAVLAPSLPAGINPAAPVVRHSAKAPASNKTAKSSPAPMRARARAQKREQRVAQARARLRSRLGSPRMMVPPLASGDVRPISPAELMQAREAFLGSRHKTAPNPPAAPRSSSSDSTLQTNQAPAASHREDGSAAIHPSSAQRFHHDAVTKAEIAGGSGAADDFVLGRYGSLLRLSRMAARAIRSAPRAKWSRGGSPLSRAPLMRGGSPRDAWSRALDNSRAIGGPNFGRNMASQALTYRGMPYIRGAASPGRGFDCSGLIYFLLRQRGFSPPRTAAELASYGHRVERNQLQSGDILLFGNTYKRGISHVGIYVGNGNFVHAARPGSGVRVDALASSYYNHKYFGARRVP